MLSLEPGPTLARGMTRVNSAWPAPGGAAPRAVTAANPGALVLVPKIVTTLRGYDQRQFLADLGAGVIVGIVALPLAIAFAIASGVTPDRGLYTAVIAGFLVSALGGSRVQIGGPTGAFVVIVYGIVQRFGVDGLRIATLMGGVMLIGFDKPYEWLPTEKELLRAIADRSALAIHRSRITHALREREARIAELSAHLLRVQEDERNRISRELHDETGQGLMVIRLYLGMLKKSLSNRAAKKKVD